MPQLETQTAFGVFLEDLHELGTPTISPSRFAEKLHMEQQALAGLAHVHRNTVSRMPRSNQLQTYLRDALRVLAAAFELAGDESRALFWYRNHPIADFGYKSAETLVSEGHADRVIEYVESLQAGAAG